MLKIGKDSIVDKKTGRNRQVTYKDADCDCDGWVDASKYSPGDYDLLFLKTEKKTFNGWASGSKWDGLRISPDEKVLFWKRRD